MIRTSPTMFNMWSCTFKLDEEKWEYVGPIQENVFGWT